MSNDTYPLDKEAFRAWLVANFRNEVGQAGLSDNCPVANFLKSTEPPELLARNTVFTDGTRRLPEWAKIFIYNFDSLYENCGLVTGQVALSVLETVDTFLLLTGQVALSVPETVDT